MKQKSHKGTAQTTSVSPFIRGRTRDNSQVQQSAEGIYTLMQSEEATLGSDPRVPEP